MAKLTLADLTNISGAEASAIATINANGTLIEAALENTLSRDGTTPNTMAADIDMDGNDLLNIGTINLQIGNLIASTTLDFIVVTTQAGYDSLSPPDSATLYLITG